MNTLHKDRNTLKRLVESYGKKDVLNFVKHLNESSSETEESDFERLFNYYINQYKIKFGNIDSTHLNFIKDLAKDMYSHGCTMDMASSFKKLPINNFSLDDIDLTDISLHKLVNQMINENILTAITFDEAVDWFDEYYFDNLTDSNYKKAKYLLNSLRKYNTILIGDNSAYSSYINQWYRDNDISYNVICNENEEEIEYWIANSEIDGITTIFGGENSGDDTCFLLIGINV